MHTANAEQKNNYTNLDIPSIQNAPDGMDLAASAAPVPELKLSMHWTRFCLTEFYGTLLATFVVDYVMYTLSAESYEDLIESGYLYLACGIAFGYFFGLLICWDAQLNVAFTFALAICNAKPWKLVPLITISQLIGAMSGHLLFYYQIGEPDLDSKLAMCFGISPPPDAITNGRILFGSFCFMGLLILALLPVFSPELGGDPNMSHTNTCLIIAVIIAGVSIAAIPSGAQTNPTMFFGGYMAMFALGFDSEYYSMHDHYWWTAIVGPFIGVIGGLCTLVFVAVITWNEPRKWKEAYLAMIAPPKK